MNFQEFGSDDLPVTESQFVFPNIKRKRSLEVVNRTVIAKLDNLAVAKLIESLHTGLKKTEEMSLNFQDISIK